MEVDALILPIDFIKTARKRWECEICPVGYSRIQIDVLENKMKDQGGLAFFFFLPKKGLWLRELVYFPPPGGPGS